jgi:hypothetical protein
MLVWFTDLLDRGLWFRDRKLLMCGFKWSQLIVHEEPSRDGYTTVVWYFDILDCKVSGFPWRFSGDLPLSLMFDSMDFQQVMEGLR